jgi:solute carrier family 38 (sodium-coupled neutral amino acid transporter), member 11
MDGTTIASSLDGDGGGGNAGGGGEDPAMEMVPVDDDDVIARRRRQRRAPPSRLVSNISLPKVKASIFGTSCNLVNSIVGAGIIGIPYAIAKSGFVLGILLLVLVGYMTDKSLRMLVETATFHPKLVGLGVLTYEDLMSIPFGRFGTLFVLVNMFIMAYGAMVAYLLIIKDTVPTVLGLGDENEAGKGSFWEREVVMLVTSLLIVVPLSMMRDMATLAFTSLFSVLADAILVLFILVYSPMTTAIADNGGFYQAVIQDNWINAKIFIGLGVLSTAMACQHSAFIVFGSLEHNTSARWAMATFRSVSTATILCLVLGVSGYLGFLQDTKGDILNNFETDSLVANAGRTLLAITMFLTYPMESFVARHVLASILYAGDLDNESFDSDSGQVIPERKFLGFMGRRERLTLWIYIAVLIPSLFVDDLGPVLSLTGSLGASCVAYIGPGLVYLGINGDEFLAYTARLLHPHGATTKRSSSILSNGRGAGAGEVELPVVGDATARIHTSPELTHPDQYYTGSGGCKPWWYWIGLFPIWTAIASSGAIGTRNFLTQLHLEHQQQDQQQQSQSASAHTASASSSFTTATAAAGDNGGPEQEIIGPRKRDYYVSMFFIFFGVIAAVVGVASNIYVEVNHIFFTPH